MIVTWYKKLFSINIQYQTSGSLASTGIILEPGASTGLLFDMHKIRCRFEPGKIDVYVPEIQIDNSPALTPVCPLELNELLFFKLNFNDNGVLEKLKFFPDSSSQELGFPLLFTGINTIATATPVTLRYEKTNFLSGIGSFLVKASDAGLNSITYTTFIIKNQAGKVVYSGATAKNNEGYFVCSYDLQLYSPGFHTLEIGSFSKLIFFDTKSEFTDSVLLIQITRNDKLKYPATLNSNAFVNFTYTIPKL